MLGTEPFGRGVVKALMSVVDGTAAVAAESSTQFEAKRNPTAVESNDHLQMNPSSLDIQSSQDRSGPLTLCGRVGLGKIESACFLSSCGCGPKMHWFRPSSYKPRDLRPVTVGKV